MSKNRKKQSKKLQKGMPKFPKNENMSKIEEKPNSFQNLEEMKLLKWFKRLDAVRMPYVRTVWEMFRKRPSASVFPK